jgi:hypothetical protein
MAQAYGGKDQLHNMSIGKYLNLGKKRRGDGLDTIILVVVVLFLLAFFGVWGLHL